MTCPTAGLSPCQAALRSCQGLGCRLWRADDNQDLATSFLLFPLPATLPLYGLDDPAVPLLGIYPRELEEGLTETHVYQCSWLQLRTVVERWKQPKPSHSREKPPLRGSREKVWAASRTRRETQSPSESISRENLGTTFRS